MLELPKKLIEDLIGTDGSLPTRRSQADKWTKTMRDRLPDRIATNVRPVIEVALAREQVVPTDNARTALADDYASMRADQIMPGVALTFEHPMQVCREVGTLANKAAVP